MLPRKIKMALAAVVWAWMGLSFAMSPQEALQRHAIQARVNDEVFTSQDVLRRVQRRWEQIDPGLSPLERQRLKEEFWREARQELVEEALLVAAGRRLAEQYPRVNHLISQMVRLELEAHRRRMGGEGQVLDFVEQQMGMTYTEFRDHLRRRQLVDFVYGREVLRPFEIRISEMRDFYERNKSRFAATPTVRFEQVALPVRPGDDLEEVISRARRIAERIAAGERVEAVAEGEGVLAEEGPPGERRLASLAPPLRNALEGMVPGEVSAPVVIADEIGPRTPREVRILRLLERAEDQAASFEEVQEEIRRRLVAERQARRYRELIEKLREMHYVWEVE